MTIHNNNNRRGKVGALKEEEEEEEEEGEYFTCSSWNSHAAIEEAPM